MQILPENIDIFTTLSHYQQNTKERVCFYVTKNSCPQLEN